MRRCGKRGLTAKNGQSRFPLDPWIPGGRGRRFTSRREERGNPSPKNSWPLPSHPRKCSPRSRSARLAVPMIRAKSWRAVWVARVVPIERLLFEVPQRSLGVFQRRRPSTRKISHWRDLTILALQDRHKLTTVDARPYPVSTRVVTNYDPAVCNNLNFVCG